ncbi:MAG TPA: hypothetical protein VEV21_01715 [Burkholderiales bacterium]|nr:hypothetical protein [Burkholderiales bacterium]
MKTQTTPVPAGEVKALIAALFERFPALVGFSIQEPEAQPATSDEPLETDLCLADVETFPPSAKRVELLGEIAAPLQELLEAAPAARELLRGRTFARALH